jgi:hypothetical protein
MSVQISPGHLDNLTPDQEEKLRQTWNTMFQLFGLASAPAPTNLIVPRETNGAAEGSTRKRVSSFFSRKPAAPSPAEEPQSASPVAAILSSASSQDLDKHSLSQAFLAATSSLSPAEIRTAFWGMTKHDHPDALLLRFLRARRWDVRAAVVMAVSALHWRVGEAKVDDDVMLKGEQGMRTLLKAKEPENAKLSKDFLDQLEMGKSFLYGVDKEGRPCCYVRVRMHKAGEQSEESLERFTVWTIETARLMLNPPVDTAVSQLV